MVKDPLDLFELDYDALASLNIGDDESPRKFGLKAQNLRKAVSDAKSVSGCSSLKISSKVSMFPPIGTAAPSPLSGRSFRFV